MAVFNLRGIPDDLAREVKATAASEGKTLVEFATDIFKLGIKSGGWTAAAKKGNATATGIERQREQGGANLGRAGKKGVGDVGKASRAKRVGGVGGSSAAIPKAEILEVEQETGSGGDSKIVRCGHCGNAGRTVEGGKTVCFGCGRPA